jgi:hypothetical protein
MKKFFTILFVCTAFCAAYAQDTLHVPGDYSTIQAGINASNNGDIVLVEDGTYTENINYRGKAITVASNFIIDGDTNHINNTIIDGSQPSNPDSGSVVTFNSGEDTNSVLCGFSITGGTGTKFQISIPIPPYVLILRNGAGILILNSGATVVNNHIIQNILDDSQVDECAGGGIAIGSLGIIRWAIIKNNLIQSNSCSNGSLTNSGGGLSIFSNAIVCGNTIRYNLASSNTQTTVGGGLHFENGDSIIVTNNFIYGNESITNSTSKLGVGGGMYFMRKDSAYVLVIGNELFFNQVKSSYWSGGSGVGFDNVNGDILFANNIIRNNHYGGSEVCHGGGIYVTNSEVQIINNTFTGNEATYGGGVCSRYSEGTVYINNIFWNDDSYAGHKEIEIIKNSGEPDPEMVYNDIQEGWTGEGNIDVDPFFVDTLYNLADSSLCIGAGIDSIEISGTWYYTPSLDFDGDPRPYPPNCIPDIGAQESPLCEPDTIPDIVANSSEILNEFSLEQNFPNPFNPSTKISWQSPVGSWQTLKVYDVLGNEVTKLVDEYKSAGSYEIEFNATDLPSGVYFYQLKAGNYVETKKMILLK